VIEGIMPFSSPKRWREFLLMLTQIDNKKIRILGLTSMMIGVGLLLIVNSLTETV